MPMLCPDCKQPIHLKKNSEGKNDVITCPLEKFKLVKTFYPEEFKKKIYSELYDEISLADSPEELKKFSELIPDKTPLSEYVIFDKLNDEVYTSKPLIIEARIRSFFLHFSRVLIDIHYVNKIHFVDSIQLPEKHQFNFLWLTPTTLRECYFRDTKTRSRFKSMTELMYPSLVVYPLGDVESIKHTGWGDILLDLITSRKSEGKATWLIKYKEFNDCPELKDKLDVQTFLKTKIPTVTVDEDINLFESVSSDSKNKDKKTIVNPAYLD